MRILCLGAGGFIGAHLTKRLLKEGHEVVAVDTHADKLAESMSHDRISYIEADIRDPSIELSDLIGSCDLTIDLIAYANPGIYVQRPVDVFQLNFTENLRIADLCVSHGKRLIQFSTCEVYGKSIAAVAPQSLLDAEDPRHATFSEDQTDLIMGPVGKHRWIYASAKQLLERVLHAYGLQGDLNYSIVRPFNFIGPDIDYLPSQQEGCPRVFSFFMDALLQGGKMQLVEGGMQRRCYTYIDDAVDCIYRIVLNPGGVCDRQIFNVGSPQNETSIRNLAELMRVLYTEKFADLTTPLPEIVEVSGEEFYGKGYEDSDRRIPDTRKAEQLLGWRPRVGLRETVERTMAYYACAVAATRYGWKR